MQMIYLEKPVHWAVNLDQNPIILPSPSAAEGHSEILDLDTTAS